MNKEFDQALSDWLNLPMNQPTPPVRRPIELGESVDDYQLQPEVDLT